LLSVNENLWNPFDRLGYFYFHIACCDANICFASKVLYVDIIFNRQHIHLSSCFLPSNKHEILHLFVIFSKKKLHQFLLFGYLNLLTIFEFQVPFLFGVTAFEKLASVIIHWIFRRTGRHLFLTDEDEGKPPLLKRMVEDYDGCYFMYVW
jgi:hypothetical protein